MHGIPSSDFPFLDYEMEDLLNVFSEWFIGRNWFLTGLNYSPSKVAKYKIKDGDQEVFSWIAVSKLENAMIRKLLLNFFHISNRNS